MYTKKKQKQIEKSLKADHYKKVWLDDKSGYWFEKTIKLFKKKQKNILFKSCVDFNSSVNFYYIEYYYNGFWNEFIQFDSYKELRQFIKRQS